MQLEVNLKFNNEARFVAFAQMLAAGGFVEGDDATPTSVSTTVSAPITSPKATKKETSPTPKKTEAEKETAKVEAASVKEPAKAETTTNAPAKIEYKDVANVAVKLCKTKGRDALVAILKKYNVSAAPKLKPEQYADFIADVNAELGE